MNKELFLLLAAIWLFIGCGQDKYFLKDNIIYQKKYIAVQATSEHGPSNKFQLNVIRLSTSVHGMIKDNGDNIIVKFGTLKNDDTSTVASFDIDLEKNPKTDLSSLDSYYFPETKLAPESLTKNKLSYFEGKPVLQGLTIPLKIRPRLTTTALLDSFPQQVESGFNAALAFGYKESYSVFNSDQGIFGQYTNRYSVTPGVFLGLGVADLQKSNTRNPVIQFGRRALSFSYGIFLVVGYNNINVGYSLGWDHALGDGSEGWLYQNKLWHGVTVGIDIIK